jgi:uncharacterized protein
MEESIPKVVIAGATGLIGRNLTSDLLGGGTSVVVLTRNAGGAHTMKHPLLREVEWDGRHQGDWVSHMNGADAVVNLSGQSIGTKRWTATRKQELLRSRIDSTEALVDAMRTANSKPRVLINASAVGYYGNVDEGVVTEDRPPGTDFLAQLCSEWEKAALKAADLGVRVVLPRSGVVLDKDAGALQRMLLPFRLFVGGPLGSGNQWFPWVHREDEIRAIIFALRTESLSGPVNIVAPEQTTMRTFAETLGTALHRPSMFRVPSSALKALLGEMAGIILTGQKAVPSRLIRAGFKFRFPTLAGALENLLH